MSPTTNYTLASRQKQTCTPTNTHTRARTHTHRHRQTHTDTQRHTETHRDTQRHTETHRDTQRHTETHRDTQRHTDTHRHRHTHTHQLTQKATPLRFSFPSLLAKPSGGFTFNIHPKVFLTVTPYKAQAPQALNRLPSFSGTHFASGTPRISPILVLPVGKS